MKLLRLEMGIEGSVAAFRGGGRNVRRRYREMRVLCSVEREMVSQNE